MKRRKISNKAKKREVSAPTQRGPFDYKVILTAFLASILAISLAHYRTQPAVPSRTASAYAVHGASLINSHQTEAALNELNEGAAIYPNNQSILLNLAIAHHHARNWQSALEIYKRVVDLTATTATSKKRTEKDLRERAQALSGLGSVYRRLKEWEQSLDSFRKSLQTVETLETRRLYADAFLNLGRYRDSTEEIFRAFSSDLTVKAVSMDSHFRILAESLASLGCWNLLEQTMNHCIQQACTFSYKPFDKTQINVMYAIALQQQKDAKMDSQLAKMTDLLGVPGHRIQEMINLHLKRFQSNRNEISDKTCADLTELLPPIFLEQAQKSWSIVQQRHLQSFSWPIPSDLLTKTRNEMDNQKTLVATKGHQHSDTLIDPFNCLGFPFFNLDDCIFVSRVKALQRQDAIIARYGAPAILRPDDFSRDDFPADGNALHVGLFSGDLRIHPMLPLVLAFLKHSNVQITLYHSSADPDVLGDLLPYVNADFGFEKSRWKSALDHARAHRVQVWLEMSGSTGRGVSMLATAGPAPVGVLWAGFPGSMADPGLQYMVSDRYTVPESTASSYPEKMIYVPGSWMIAEPAPLGKWSEEDFQAARIRLRKQHEIPVDAVVYSNFGRLWKVDDVIFESWCQILREVPNSYLILSMIEARALAGIENMRGVWKAKGLSENRLKFLSPFRPNDLIQSMAALSDIALDTSSYGGGATSYDALRAGLPLVHYSAGFKMMQRAGGSMLTAAGLQDSLVCTNLTEYVDVAIRLGLDPSLRQKINHRLKGGTAGSGGAILFKPEIAVSKLVEGLREAYALWYHGKRPSRIFADTANNTYSEA